MMPVIKKDFYGNIQMLAPNGTLLCRTSQKRADWYLVRGLAEKLAEDCIKLLFEPAGQPEQGEVTPVRHNHCVVCGCTERLTRHHMVPRLYRRKFPNEYKNHCCYDVVMICEDCHERYEGHAFALKEQLGERCGVTFKEAQMASTPEVPTSYRMNSIAYALMTHGEYMPKERKAVLHETLERSVGRKIEESEYDKFIGEKRPHCTQELQDVHVSSVIDKEGVEGLILIWRNHFLETMEPKFLPADWNRTRIVRARLRVNQGVEK